MQENMNKKGQIAIDAQNIMPVIKRWLYSDKDIFIREMVSNATDAINKLKLAEPGLEADFRVTVRLDKKAKTLSFIDNGIGMTEPEVEQYINQVAFSGAEDFLKQYTAADQNAIIGHFGMGFYSAFMAAHQVTIDSLSYKEGARPVHWQSDDAISFEMTEGTRTERGTTITLHISDEEKEFLEGARVREVLDKYCAYMPVPIYFEDLEDMAREEKEQTKRRAERAAKAAEKAQKKAKGEDTDDKAEEPAEAPLPIPRHLKPINYTEPLWLRAPKDCTDEEYVDSYHKLFHTFEDPLFWIHLNVDYPFRLKGILYFPRIRRDFGAQDGEIKLYSRQVFVADNIKEVIPEFLMLLKGALDIPDLPLNVSRSFLQNDGFVRKLSRHIVKKVADKLTGLFKTAREDYQRYWDDIHPFIKFGCMKDHSFFEAVKDSLLVKTTAGNYLTLAEYSERNKDKTDNKVIYATDPARQAAAIALYTGRDIDVAIMDSLIDLNFMSFLEHEDKDGPRFVRVDADITGLKTDDFEGQHIDQEAMQDRLRKALNDPHLSVKVEALSDATLPLVITEDEQMRRYKDMSVIYGEGFAIPSAYTLILNAANASVQALSALPDGELFDLTARQLFDLARLSSRPLEQDDLKQFIARSREVISQLLGHETATPAQPAAEADDRAQDA